jgi:hypothetical protein
MEKLCQRAEAFPRCLQVSFCFRNCFDWQCSAFIAPRLYTQTVALERVAQRNRRDCGSESYPSVGKSSGRIDLIHIPVSVTAVRTIEVCYKYCIAVETRCSWPVWTDAHSRALEPVFNIKACLITITYEMSVIKIWNNLQKYRKHGSLF